MTDTEEKIKLQQLEMNIKEGGENFVPPITEEVKIKGQTKKYDYKVKSKLVSMPEEIKVLITAIDLVVVTKIKDLVNYIFKITDKSPKKFRFTFVNRMHNLCLDIVEKIFKANEVDMRVYDEDKFALRQNLQKDAMTGLKLLEYIALLACENECITFHQYEFIAKSGAGCMILLGNWIESDERRKSWLARKKG
ncbi:MAG: four helix bundle protein [Clostridia bacterium]|nr:four helix bundle protein [Clostridia bacterium]